MNIEIRDEDPNEAPSIRRLTEAAFKLSDHSSGTEGAIIEALRRAGALSISLVAIRDAEILGHVAFSPVTIDGRELDWYGLGPVSVRPDVQGNGIGSALIREGLVRLKDLRAAGCVLLGDPAYYGRFGFKNDPALRFVGAPAEYFLALPLGEAKPSGVVVYHEGFAAA